MDAECVVCGIVHCECETPEAESHPYGMTGEEYAELGEAGG